MKDVMLKLGQTNMYLNGIYQTDGCGSISYHTAEVRRVIPKSKNKSAKKNMKKRHENKQ